MRKSIINHIAPSIRFLDSLSLSHSLRNSLQEEKQLNSKVIILCFWFSGVVMRREERYLTHPPD